MRSASKLASRLLPLALAWLPLVAGGYDAPRPPTASARYLAMTSYAVVLAEPLAQDAGQLPAKYRVLEVIRFEASPFGYPLDPLADPAVALEPGQTLELKLDHRYSIQPERQVVAFEKRAAKLKPCPLVEPGKLKRALVFLDWETGRWRLGHAGVRLLTESGAVLTPWNFGYPQQEDPFRLMPLQVAWDGLLKQVRSDVAAADSLLRLRRIADPAARCEALMKWIEANEKDFVGASWGWDIQMDADQGWSYFEHEVTRWVFETGLIDPCWRLMELGDRLEKYDAVADGSLHAFHSEEGRRLLVSKCLDARLPLSLRTSAVRELSRSLWRGTGVRPQRDPSVAERRRIIAEITPLLDHRDFAFRAETLQCIEKLSAPYVGNRDTRPLIRDAVAALSQRYRLEGDEQLRPMIVRCLLELTDERQWRALSGNPRRMAVLLRDFSSGRDMRIGMDLYHGAPGGSVQLEQMPRLHCERLVDGQPVETRVVATELVNDQGNRGSLPTWGQFGRLEVSAKTDDFAAGKWRVRARGTLAGGEAWVSEPLMVSRD